MKWAVLGLALVTAACSGPGSSSPVAEKITRPDGTGWTVPAHVCAVGTSANEVMKDGSVVQTCTSEGKLVGLFVQWHSNGQKALEGKYEDNERVGTWVQWHDNGNVAVRGDYSRGEEVGRWVWYHPNGRKKTEGDHFDGMRAGLWTTWFATGTKQAEGQYRADEKDSTWRYWLSDGTPEKEEVWEIGLLKQEKVLKGGRRK